MPRTPTFAFDFVVTVKVNTEAEKNALKDAKSMRGIALVAMRSNGPLTATVKASPVAVCGK